MSKIRAMVTAEVDVDDSGLYDLGNDNWSELDYYICSDCNKEFSTWEEADEHIPVCDNKGELE